MKHMERKFESELAGQVARRHKNPVGNRAQVLIMTVVSCAVMIGAAAAVLSLGASAALGSGTDYTEITPWDGEDYLIGDGTGVTYTSDLPEDQLFLAKRTSVLKWVEFDTPGNSEIDYTKVVYNTSVKLRAISNDNVVLDGMVIADLTINGFTTYAPWIASASMWINGVEVGSYSSVFLGVVPFITPVWDSVTGTLSVDVTLPAGQGYAEDDLISIFVMFKTSETLLTITGSEIGFPDYQPALEPL